MAIDRENSPYRRGNRYGSLPIPMVAEHCITVEAGAVQFKVESRRLTNAIIEAEFGDADVATIPFDDHGASLHVCGTRDGLEHLRFDCFEHEPHYHYIDQAAGANTVVRIDEMAVGDPVEFSLGCVEHHLADMLRHSAPEGLADEVASHVDAVRTAVGELRGLMRAAAAPVS